jgi:hypothetical protein
LPFSIFDKRCLSIELSIDSKYLSEKPFEKGCQQNEPVQKPVLNAVELENLLKTNSAYKDLVTELNVAANAFLGDLRSNFSKLPKEELENMNRIWIKYGSGKDFIGLATESKKNVFKKTVSKSSSTAFNNSISKLIKEVSLKYSYESNSIYSILNTLFEDMRNKNSLSRTAKSIERCEHEALSRYYSLLGDGVREFTAEVYMQGYYVGCIRGDE